MKLELEGLDHNRPRLRYDSLQNEDPQKIDVYCRGKTRGHMSERMVFTGYHPSWRDIVVFSCPICGQRRQFARNVLSAGFHEFREPAVSARSESALTHSDTRGKGVLTIQKTRSAGLWIRRIGLLLRVITCKTGQKTLSALRSEFCKKTGRKAAKAFFIAFMSSLGSVLGYQFAGWLGGIFGAAVGGTIGTLATARAVTGPHGDHHSSSA